MTTELIRRLAADQHGIVTRAQLLNAGVGPDSIDHWIKTGRLIKLHRGVYALGHLPPSPYTRTMAAVLAWACSLTRHAPREAAPFRRLLA